MSPCGRSVLAEKYGQEVANEVPLLYGGSVNTQNAAELAVLPHVDGLFVGRAALEADGLADLVEIARRARQQLH